VEMAALAFGAFLLDALHRKGATVVAERAFSQGEVPVSTRPAVAMLGSARKLHFPCYTH